MIIHDVKQGTEPWHLLRAGVPTASEFSRLLTSTGKESASLMEYAHELAANKYAGVCLDGFSGNKFTKRGNEKEEDACSDYEMINQVEVEHVGFITNNLMTQGCSPDGLVGKDGGLEIKCKIGKVHSREIEEMYKTGSIPSENYAQVQGCLLITGKKWWDFYMYHPNLPSMVKRVYPDKDYFKSLRKALKTVVFERDEIIKFYKMLGES